MRGEIRIHHSLITPVLLFGVPRSLAIFNGTLAAATVLGLQTFMVLPVCAVVHVAGVLLTRRDPAMFRVLMRHLRQKSYYGL